MALRSSSNGFTTARPAVLGLAKVMSLLVAQLSLAGAAPLKQLLHSQEEDPPMSTENPNLYLYLGISVLLVLLGGAFAGLTIALMGQDGIYLQVIATSGEGKEQRHAQRVYRLLLRGKHWVLVTLLLSNVITNETLPIVLDRSLGGGWPAVLSSTVLIVIFGEIIPQAICVRYGMQIGAFCSPFVLVLMYLMAPVAWPTAKLLDWVLGEDHGTVYKKSGLKTLVTLHKTLGSSPSDRLNQDEVTIISAVLDLKDKPVGDIMTPMEDVFTMSADTILDEKMMDLILSAGYSRIPIYEPGNESNFVGMLLVKILITYDPEDCKRVSDFALATLPETRPETSCLDIVNFFQEGKSHMVLVSEYPGENYGGLGVITLEDVIEELIGEEIIDESDVYIDVHKAIRRLNPAPKARISKGHIVASADSPALTASEDHLIDISEDQPVENTQLKRVATLDRTSSSGRRDSSPKATFLMRRGSNTADGSQAPVLVRGNANDMREHLKHLGPSNLASRPRETKYSTVKIKPGQIGVQGRQSVSEEVHSAPNDAQGEGDSLLRSVPDQIPEYGNGTSTGNFYGTANQDGIAKSPTQSQRSHRSAEAGDFFIKTQSREGSPVRPNSGDPFDLPASPSQSRTTVAKSGEITQSMIDSGGVQKLVLVTTHSGSEEERSPDRSRASGTGSSSDKGNEQVEEGESDNDQNGHGDEVKPEDVKKKKRQRRRKRNRKGKGDGTEPSEEQ